MINKPLLIFDGDCGFCTTSAEWAVRHVCQAANIVPGQRIDVTEYGLTLDDIAAAAWWVDEGGRTYRGHRAIGKLLQRGEGWWWPALGWLCLTPPFSWTAALIYRVVARFRHRLPGGTPACRIDQPRG